MIKTGPQIAGMTHIYLSNSTENIINSMPRSYHTLREIKKHPTIKIARQQSIAPILGASWSIEGPDVSDEIINDSQDFIDRLRYIYVKKTMEGLYDYGFVSFEQYLDDNENLQLKPLYSDFVSVRLDAETGEYLGLEVTSPYEGFPTLLKPEECVFLGLDVEAGNFFGTGILEVVKKAYEDWKTVNDASHRYDAKVAGTSIVVHYPSDVVNQETKIRETTNRDVAKEVLDNLESSGGALVPGAPIEAFQSAIDGKVPDIWKIDYVGDNSPKQGSFLERQRYLDTLMVRSYGLPERSILEANGGGTNAESLTQSSLAIDAMESIHYYITEEFNKQIFYPYIELMYGENINIWISPGPISKDNINYKRGIMKDLISKNPLLIDADALMDEIGLPKSKIIVDVVPNINNNPVNGELSNG